MTHPAFPHDAAAPVSALLQIETALHAGGTDLSALDILVGRRLNLIGFCAMLKSLPAGGPGLTRRLAPALAAYLTCDFPALIAEEEEGLLRFLNRRLLLGDDLDDVIRQLSDEHRQDCEQARGLAARCRDFAAGTDQDWPDLCEALADFAERQFRHLRWEDATLLPVARERLSAGDLDLWRAEMDRRHHFTT